MIEVIGTDAGAPASLPPAHQELLRQSALVAAPRRLHAALQSWAGVSGPALIASDQPEPLLEQLRGLDAEQRAVVLASGDPLWFGIGRLLLETCTDFARVQGYATMKLWTHQSHEAANTLYLRNGWEIIEEKPVFNYGQSLIERVMQLKL